MQVTFMVHLDPLDHVDVAVIDEDRACVWLANSGSGILAHPRTLRAAAEAILAQLDEEGA